MRLPVVVVKPPKRRALRAFGCDAKTGLAGVKSERRARPKKNLCGLPKLSILKAVHCFSMIALSSSLASLPAGFFSAMVTVGTGAVFLKERCGRRRIAAAVAVALDVVLLNV